jgi:hypothetical protein
VSDAFGRSFSGCSRKFLNLSFAFFIHFFDNLRNGAFLFHTDFILNSLTQVSDRGLTALGSSLQDMKILTNLSLVFPYFFQNSLRQFQTRLREIFPIFVDFHFCQFSIDSVLTRLSRRRICSFFCRHRVHINKFIYIFQHRADTFWNINYSKNVPRPLLKFIPIPTPLFSK